MSVLTMIIWIVAISVIGDIVKRIISTRSRTKKTPNNNDQVEKLIEINQKLNQQVKSLEQRINHIETIVTDEGYDLKRKISGL